MRTADVIKAIKRHRGPVFTALYGVDDVYWVQCVKADLLAVLAGAGDGQLEASLTDGDLYVSRA